MKHSPYSLDFTLRDFWLFLSLKRELHGWNFETDAQVIQEIQMIFGCILKEFENAIKKMGRKNESKFSCKWMIFRKRKCQMYGLRKWEWCEWIHLCFRSFLFSFFWTGMPNYFHKTNTVTCDLFDVQASAGVCWKYDELQNMCASSGFR